METLPLYNLFVILRKHELPLGISDYLTALHTLQSGIGTGSRQELIFMCQVLWGKSVEEQDLIKTLIDNILPDPLTPDQLERIFLTEELAPPDERTDSQTVTQTSYPTPADTNLTSRDSDPIDLARQPKSQRSTVIEEVEEVEEETKYILLDPDKGQLVINASLNKSPITHWHFDSTFDLSGTLPISRRHMKRAWRFYRRMQRVGPKVELDVRATIELINRQGVITNLVLVPRRTNRARVLIFIDVNITMIPFRRITQEIVNSAIQNNLAQAQVVYFQRTPGQIAYFDEGLHESQPLPLILSKHIDNGILIMSDAGVSAATNDWERASKTQVFIDTARKYSQNIAWLNPFPAQRWRGTTAEIIRKNSHIPMFNYSRQGLERAVDTLRGK